MMDGARSSPPRFILDGQVIEADVAPTTTLLQYLRETLGRTGTKEGCAEGDCGACTVVIGEPGDEGVRYRAINSCIRFVPTLDGREVITSESLADAAGCLHPVQQAMVNAHASQCGFCTPGFVMSLFALYLNNPTADRVAVVDALSGNLCRCTGYRPIIDAGLAMQSLPETGAWSRAQSQSAERVAALRAIQREDTLEMSAAPGYAAPTTLAELARRYAEAPAALLLAGGTDVGLWVTKQFRDLPPLLYIGAVRDLSAVTEQAGQLEIGAAVSLTEAFEAIVARYPTLAEVANRFASPPVRNSGTLCGNIANGSPIGDSMPVLIALGATVRLRHGESERVIPLEDLYLGYQKKSLAPGELVVSVLLPLPSADDPVKVATYKISKRYEQDISAVCAAFAMRVQAGVVVDARICFGGVGPTPMRARRVEAALIGQPFSEVVCEAARRHFSEDFQPISDMRASAAYRQTVASNLLRRFYLEISGQGMPLMVHSLQLHTA